MKKIHVAILITALGLAGALLVHTRGGGGGLGSSAPEQVLPVQLKSNAMPEVCSVVDQAINPLQDRTRKQLSSTCRVEFPENLQVVTYCANKAAKLGAANITLPQGTSQFLSIPKNCTVLLNDESLYAKTIVCSGPVGSTVKISAQNSCTSPAANLPKVIEPNCPPGSELPDWTSWCRYVPPPNSPPCPQNYHYDSYARCCMENNKDFPWISSACPLGYQPLDTWKPGMEESTYEKVLSCVRDTSLDIKTDTHNYTITLGSCGEKKSKDTDKPKSCTLDPATGVCQ